MNPVLADLNRTVVRSYVRHSPLQRGKHRLVDLAAPYCPADRPFYAILPGGARMALDVNEHVQRDIFFFGLYETDTARWFQDHVREGMTVLDIGAHVGQYSLLAAPKAGPSGAVYAFEPSPPMHQRLVDNILLNRYRFTNVTAQQIALSDQGGQVVLFVPNHDNGGEGSLYQTHPDVTPTVVPAMTLDAWVEQERISRVDMIKIDVQGHEEKVLRGGEQTLARFRPTIVCEFEERWLNSAGSSCRSLKMLMQDWGYRIMRIIGSGLAAVGNQEVHGYENLVLMPPPR